MTPRAPREQRRKVPWWVFEAISDRTPGRVTWIRGGVGAGKSHGSQIWDLQRMLDNGAPRSDANPTRSWTVAPNYRICETLLELTLKVAQDVYGWRDKKQFHVRLSSPHSIDFRPLGKNHRISFLSADNPTHFVASSITHWRWSEVAVSKADVFDKLMDRLRDKRAKCLQGLGDSVPEGINHYSELADIPGTGYDRLDQKRNFRAFIVPTDHNAHNLAPGYIEALDARYAYDPSKLQSYRYGLFVPFQKSTAYWNFAESRNVGGDELKADPNLPLAFCWDFNVAPLAWTVHQRQPFYPSRFSNERAWRFVALDESSGLSRGLEQAVTEFAEKFPVRLWRHVPIHLHGDRSGYNRVHNAPGCDYDQIAKYLASAGYERVEFKAPQQNPEIRPCLEKMAAAMDYGLYIVHHRCKNLIDSFRRTALKDGTWDIEKPGTKDTWTHYGDSARYYVFEETKLIDLSNPSSKPLRGFSL